MKLLLVFLLATAVASSSYPGYDQVYTMTSLGPQYYPYPVGRQGIGFDLRTAKTFGFRTPYTPKLFEVLRKYPDKEAVIYGL